MIWSFIESCLRGLDGRVGKYLRYWYYKRRLKACGKRVFIDTGVHLINPQSISIGDEVWIDKNSILIAGILEVPAKSVTSIETVVSIAHHGEIHIGSYSHIGLMTVIQGHGGVWIDKYFTSSAGVKIYSLSNDPKACHTGTLIDPAYIFHPVSIGQNVWLGLNVIVLGHSIGRDVFVGPNEIVKIDLPEGIIFNSASTEYKFRFNRS